MFSESTQELHGMGSSKSLAVFAAGAALVVSGCTGGGEPEADPTPILPESSEPADPSPSPSESEAADAEPPEMPDAARERSFAGAEAFIEYWAETLTFSLNSGDTKALDAVSASDCGSCSDVVGLIDEVYADGGSIESVGWEVNQLGFSANRIVRMPVARFDRGREVVRRAGEEPERFPPAQITLSFDLAKTDEGWVVNDFTAQE